MNGDFEIFLQTQKNMTMQLTGFSQMQKITNVKHVLNNYGLEFPTHVHCHKDW